MRRVAGSLIFLGLMLLIDLYVFQAVKTVSANAGQRTKWIIYITYWLVSALSVTFIALLPYVNYDQWQRPVRTYIFAIIIGLFLAKVIALLFFLADDIRRIFQWIIGFFVTRTTDAAPGHEAAEGITRSVFLSWLGIGAGSALFGTLLYGFRNQYNYHVKKIQLAFANLPAAFKGLKIVQISDIHSGSFMDKKAVAHGVQMINDLKPDIILFTGDLVNDRSTEMEPYMDVFNQLKAPMGVYSTLGNHDYGDYVAWESPAAKLANLDALKTVHAKLGWRLLLNEHVELERNGAKIGLLGVENISGRGRFHSYGSMADAYSGAKDLPFKILMSHDPSHWDSEVRPKFPDVDLTLSGHTHGMQFGIELPGFKWSPVKWMYKQWAGLYEDGTQKLYVNRGFGFIGYPGRVGILPEITLIELV